jgi:DNA-binding LytR/AlgR family response regulator
MKLKCVAVDDDILSLAVLEKILSQIPHVKISGVFSNAISAFQFLKTEKIDILFLDIEMPDLTGIELLKNLTNPPRVIIVSGNAEYALEGYEFNVFDYILKPISAERILKSVYKIFETKYKITQSTKNKNDADFLFLKDHKKMIKVEIKNILFLESIKDYIKVVCCDKTVITKQSMSFFESFLNQEQFLRIHKSFIISTSRIDAYDAVSVEIGKIQIPIGRTYKENVFKILDLHNDTDAQ